MYGSKILKKKKKKKTKKQTQTAFEKASGIGKGKKRMERRQNKAATILAKLFGNDKLYLTETGKKFARKINQD